jgi:choline/glycine/proline betaine transport protein
MTGWRDNLNQFLDASDRKRRVEVEGDEWGRFIASVVVPAFEEVAAELEKHGRSVSIRNSVTSARLLVQNEGEEEILYSVQAKSMPDRILPYAEVRSRERKGRRYLTTENMFRPSTPAYKLADITKEEIIENFLASYMRRVERA